MSVVGKRVGILVQDGFDDSQLAEPLKALNDAGATVLLIGTEGQETCRGMHDRVIAKVDRTAGDVQISEIDALVIPGGLAVEKMRLSAATVALVREAAQRGKIIASIAHGAQLLISAGVLSGRQTACYPPIAVDVRNAGGTCLDQPVVRDANLIAACSGEDIGAFCDVLIEALGGGKEAAAS